MSLIALLVVFLVVAIAAVQPLPLVGSQPALAQRIRPDNVWKIIYEELPELPLENQYISKETNEPATDNTLVGRLIRYHIYTKGRPPFFRLDWKITMADYLGVNGIMDETTYPSRDTLEKNPLEGDVSAVKRLTRKQRNELIQALVDVFTTPTSANSSQPVPTTLSKPSN